MLDSSAALKHKVYKEPRRLKRRAVLAGVAATLAVCVIGCSTEYRVMDRVPSPSGSIIAVTYVGMGGGAAGWCDARLALVAKDAPMDPAQIDKAMQYVFSASCGSDIKLTWLSGTAFRISYQID